jgi:hypothetical protein
MPAERCSPRIDGSGVVSGLLPGFLDAREHKDLEIHAEAEEKAEHQDGDQHNRVAERLEREHIREVTLLEDPDKCTEGSRQ